MVSIRRTVAAAGVLACVIFAGSAVEAGAQEDPYAPTTTVVDGQPIDNYSPADCSAGPSITISTSNAQRGAKVTVTVKCFKPGASVTITMFSTPTVLTTVAVDAVGSASTEVTVPCDKEEGSHTIEAKGENVDGTTGTASAAISLSGTVCGATTTNNGTNSGNTSNLARTGASIGIAVALGAMLLGLGYMLIRKADAMADEA